MGLGIGVIELLVVVVVVITLISMFTRKKQEQGRGTGLKSLFSKPATLTCWHCGQTTSADSEVCQQCGRELV